MLRLLVLIALCASCAPIAQRATAAPGALARVEASLDADGKPVGHDGARATVVVVFASWCEHCHHELATLADLRASHPGMRILGVNYKAHEEYNRWGSSEAVRAYVSEHAPWLRVVPCDDALFDALGRPAMVPTLYVYDAGGTLVAAYDRRERPQPERAELDELLRRLGA